jgi:hypothetical protein
LGEHYVPIRLLCGFPHLFAIALTLILALALLAAMMQPALPANLKLFLTAFAWLLLAHWLRDQLTGPVKRLVIFPDGRVIFSERPGIDWEGELTGQSWQRRRLLTISVRLVFGTEHLVIFRARQRKGDFRRLRIRLTHEHTKQRS